MTGITTRQAFEFAIIAMLVACLSYIVQVVSQTNFPGITDWRAWLISTGAGLVAATARAALPWLMARLPSPPSPPTAGPPDGQ